MLEIGLLADLFVFAGGFVFGYLWGEMQRELEKKEGRGSE